MVTALYANITFFLFILLKCLDFCEIIVMVDYTFFKYPYLTRLKVDHLMWVPKILRKFYPFVKSLDQKPLTLLLWMTLWKASTSTHLFPFL